jgi:DNA-binding SARP family transcriptional activator
VTETVLRLLGDAQLRVVDEDGTARTVAPQPGRVSGLLGLLALNVGKVVTVERLVDELWLDNPPETARATVHVNISRLRRQLRETTLSIVTRPPGYVLQAPDDSIDLHVYAGLVRRAQAAATEADWDAVIALSERAQELWRGEPFPSTVVAVLEVERDHVLGQRRTLTELHCRALLERGRESEALVLARWLHDAEPYAEIGTWATMKALHALGRTPAALEAFEVYRRSMADDLGLDPGTTVAGLHLDILRAGAADLRESDDRSDGAIGDRHAAGPPTDPATVDPPHVDAAQALGLLGRERETRAVDDVLAGVRLQRPAVMLLEGDAGIGKTTLARYASMQAERQGCRVVWARGVDGLAMPPLSMWRRVLAELESETLPAMDVAQEAERAFELYDALVDRVFARIPTHGLVIVLDDIQWADDGTLQALQLMANRLWDERLAVIVTRRPTSARVTASGATALDRITREQVTQRVALEPLTIADLQGAARDGHSSEALLQRTGGNPFLVNELLKLDPTHLVPGRPTVPAGVLSIIHARALALPRHSRDLVDTAAVAGRTLDLAVLADVFQLSAPEVIARLEPAVQHRLLVVEQARPTWSFEHDLCRDAILELQTPRQRSEQHARLADAIERVHVDDLAPVLADLAMHRYEAALGQQSMSAFDACSAAADAAAAQLAFDQAAHHRACALATLARTPENREKRISCLISLTRERRHTGDVLGASAALDEAQRLATASNDDELTHEALVLLGGPTLWNWRQLDEVDTRSVDTLDRLISTAASAKSRAELLGTLGVELYYSDERDRGIEAARSAVAIARTVDDDELLARTLNNLAIATWVPTHSVERRAAIDESLAMGSRLPRHNEVIARLHRAPLLLREGNISAARADLSRAEWLTPRLSLPEVEGQLASQLAGIAMLEGDETWAQESIERAYDVLSRTSLWGGLWVRQIHQASLARDQGRLDDVLEELVHTASQDAFRVLRWTAVLALAETGNTHEARSRQKRWGLTSVSRPYWNADFDDVQAGMVSALLGSPDPATCYQHLLPSAGTLAVAGTGLAVWGPVDDVLADLAERMDHTAAAARHRRDADALRRAVSADLTGLDAGLA